VLSGYQMAHHPASPNALVGSQQRDAFGERCRGDDAVHGAAGEWIGEGACRDRNRCRKLQYRETQCDALEKSISNDIEESLFLARIVWISHKETRR
jgi:hypothetical protein